MLDARTVFGLSFADAAVVAAILGYVVSLLRNWRPMGVLRSENRDLRAALQEAVEQRHKLEERVGELEREVTQLKRATDLSPIAQQQQQGIRVLEELVREVKQLDGSIKANTAAVETLSKRRIIDEALDEREGAPT